MAIDFPGTPAVGDTFTSGTTSWTWNGTAWVASPAGNWVEAPSDNQRYARRNQAWTLEAIQTDAPSDGQIYRRQFVGGTMTWQVDPIGADAPAAANTYYGRVNAAWANLEPAFARKSYVDSQDTNNYNAAINWTNAIAIPIGGVIMYGGGGPPARFVNCDGAVYNISDIPQLAPILGTTYGGNGTTTCGVPNLSGRFPLHTTRGALGGAGSFALGIGNLPPHQHLVPAHNHGISDPGHAHAQVPHSHAVWQDQHNHSYFMWTTGSGVAVYGQATYYQQNVATTDNMVTPPVHCDTQQPGIYAAGTGVSVQNNGPWATDPSWGQGSGAAIGLYPPYTGIIFCIRYV